MSEHEEKFDEIERRMNVQRLKHEVEEAIGGKLTASESEDTPPEVAEQFWQNVLNYEKAPWTTHLEQLTADGLTLPAPEELDEDQLSLKLWQAIDALAKRHVYLECTDHLSDRELYSELWREALREPVRDLSSDPNGAWHIDLIGSGSEEDTYLGLKHYWDEDSRAHWIASFPDYDLPPHEEPPYDRDRHLPQRRYDFDDDMDEGS